MALRVLFLAALGRGLSAVAAAGEAAGTPPQASIADPTPLGPEEQYLAPYESELADARDSPIGRRFIFLANLVDVLPTWLEDLFIPLFIKHSTVTIPIGKSIPIHIPGLPSELEIVDVSINDLNKFSVLKPAQLLPGTRYSWATHLGLEETTITVNTKLQVGGLEAEARLTLPSKQLTLDAETILAFNRTKLCEVWGATMRSSGSCALQPLFADAAAGASGLRVTSLRVSVQDFDVDVEVTGAGPLGVKVGQLLAEAVRAAKPEIIEALPGLVSVGLRVALNELALKTVAGLHEADACPVSTLPVAGGWGKVVNVSRVCVDNAGGFSFLWSYANCPAHTFSSDSGHFPMGRKMCMDVESAFPGAVEGQILRLQTHARGGIHEVIDPAFRYVKGSNAAAFQCSGTTLRYHCDFVSVAPVSPSALPEVAEVCVLNQGGFSMDFEGTNLRTGTSAGTSGHYPKNRRECLHLANAAGAAEGDEYQLMVHARAGKTHPTAKNVKYRENDMSVTFQCRGHPRNFDCEVLELGRRGDPTAPADQALEVAQVLV